MAVLNDSQVKPMDLLCLGAAQMPRTQELTIFMMTIYNDRQTKSITLSLMHMYGAIRSIVCYSSDIKSTSETRLLLHQWCP